MPLKTDEKKKIIKKYAQDKGDTGSPEIQIALLSLAIQKLKDHLSKNNHDQSAKRGLLDKISKRRRLLRYLAVHDQKRYEKLIKSLGLKK